MTNIKEKIYALLNDSLFNNDDELVELYEEVKFMIEYKKAGIKNDVPHMTESVLHPQYGQSIEIDENIAPLMEEIWKAEIKTNNSCEDNCPKNYVWICFNSGKDLEKFLGIVFNGYLTFEEHDCYMRALFSNRHSDGAWIYNENIDDAGEYFCDDDDEGTFVKIYHNIEVNMSVRFPSYDRAYIYKKLKIFNEEKTKTPN